MKLSIGSLAAASTLLAAPLVATAGGGYTSGAGNAGQEAWTQEAFHEPCMNGDVSASGRFSSQLAEDKARFRMGAAQETES